MGRQWRLGDDWRYLSGLLLLLFDWLDWAACVAKVRVVVEVDEWFCGSRDGEFRQRPGTSGR